MSRASRQSDRVGTCAEGGEGEKGGSVSLKTNGGFGEYLELQEAENISDWKWSDSQMDEAQDNVVARICIDIGSPADEPLRESRRTDAEMIVGRYL
jgi:hypothetical protein